jgi:hypothetical protein
VKISKLEWLLVTTIWVLITGILMTSCTSGTDKNVTIGGQKYDVTWKKMLGVTYSSKRDPVLTEEEFDEGLGREKKKHSAKIEMQEEEQEYRKQRFITILTCVCVGLAVVFALLWHA